MGLAQRQQVRSLVLPDWSRFSVRLSEIPEQVRAAFWSQLREAWSQNKVACLRYHRMHPFIDASKEERASDDSRCDERWLRTAA